MDTDTDTTAPPTSRACPVCHNPLPGVNPQRIYCSPPCKAEGWRRDHTSDTDRQPIARKTPAPPPAAILRDCPHCGETVEWPVAALRDVDCGIWRCGLPLVGAWFELRNDVRACPGRRRQSARHA